MACRRFRAALNSGAKPKVGGILATTEIMQNIAVGGCDV